MAKAEHIDLLIDELLQEFHGDVALAQKALRQHATAQKSKSRRPITASNEVVISVEGVSKKYKVGKQQIDALQDISLTIQRGEFVALTGPSGSGKSTLLQLIGGLDRPSTGSLRVDGQDIALLSDRKLSEFRNKTVGFVFQFFYLQPFLQLQKNLEVPGMFARSKPSDRHKKSVELATRVGLNQRLSHLPKELSGGQMQRAAIARALINQPKILLADEPTGNLDSKNSSAIINLFEQIRSDYDMTIVIVTHDHKIASRADRQICLNDGKVVA